MFKLSTKDARRLAIIQQGLHSSKPFGSGNNALLSCIERLGYIQIDTISVINRAHHHTFWTRIPSYQEQQLDALLLEREIMEYWSHAAAYLPMQDYRFCLPYMNAIAGGQKHWREPDKKMMKKVLERIRVEGPLMAKHFDPPKEKKGGSWWSWKPAKQALEQLFIEGKLMVSHRTGFHKVYDLAERVLPSGLDTRTPSKEEYERHLIQRSMQAHGLIAEQELSYLRKGMKPSIKAQLNEMLAANEIVLVEVDGKPYYSSPQIIQECSGQRINKMVSLLNPFDNAIIQRKRVAALFDFSYQMECYVPAVKRQFGYYCLPILYGAEIVGRLDPKADRKNKTFIIQNLFIEKEIADIDAFTRKLADKIQELSTFNGCEKIILKGKNSTEIHKQLENYLIN
ncbi:YcaQ family DNA glycosylase [Haliea sp. AH-315-K21]|uniref:Winged helix-turn-helix domain-containing protein n=1 Tax=SAR86 cluster bacterium TaxID=2030880 RepID=A0A2A5C9D8_9GAMM|nr:YcaQ family DNA glycosylase [Haliea sp. AH-315-K21]PCJ39986.1 MAG: hypothetical protein COA71_12495 [SAR86 cluster bacterium]